MSEHDLKSVEEEITIRNVSQFATKMTELFVGKTATTRSQFLGQTYARMKELKIKEEKGQTISVAEKVELGLGKMWTANWLAVQESRFVWFVSVAYWVCRLHGVGITNTYNDNSTNTIANHYLQRSLLKDRAMKWKFMAAVCHSFMDECFYFWMVPAQEAITIKELGDFWKSLSVNETHASSSDIAQKLQRCEIRIKNTESMTAGEEIAHAWQRFVKDLWDKEWNARMSKVFKRVMKKLSPSLDNQWRQWMETDAWQVMLEGILETAQCKNAANNRYTIKAIPFHLIMRSTMAVHHALTIASIYHCKIQPLLDKSQFWSVDTLLTGLLFVLGIWPKWIAHWWSPNKVHDPQSVYVGKMYGLRMCILGWYLCMFGVNGNKWQSQRSLATVIAPLDHYGWSCLVNKVVIPSFVCKDETVAKRVWNPKNDNKHYTNKYTVLGVVVMAAMVEKYYDVMLKVYGQEKFTQENDFGSDKLKDGIAAVMQYHLRDQTYVTDNEMKSIEKTLNELNLLKCTFHLNDETIGITQFYQERRAAGM